MHVGWREQACARRWGRGHARWPEGPRLRPGPGSRMCKLGGRPTPSPGSRPCKCALAGLPTPMPGVGVAVVRAAQRASARGLVHALAPLRLQQPRASRQSGLPF